MFDYEFDENVRPKGRMRTQPEIPGTPYSNPMPARRIKISRAEYMAERILYGIKNYSSPSEAMLALWVYTPHIVIAGSLAVSAADGVFNLGIAQELAEVKVDKDGGALEQTIQTIAHEVGVAAGGQEK